MTWPYAIIGLLSAADALIGGYVFFKNPSKPLNRVFFAFSFGMAIIGAGMVLLFVTHHIVFDRVIFAGGYLMILGLVLLSVKFPADEPLRPAAWLAFLPLAVLAALTPSGFLVKEVIFRPDGILEPVNGPGIHAFAVVIGAYVLLSGWKFWKRYGSLSGAARLQMQYLVLGAGIFAFTILVCNVILPALGIFELNMLGPASSVVFVGAVAYAIARHRLLDIRLVIQRGAVYLFLLAMIVGFYLALIFAMGTWFHRTFEQPDALFLIVGLLAACVGIFTVPVLERRFRRATDRFFFKDRYDYPKALRRLSAILNQSMETAKILKRTSQALKETLRAAEARVILFGKDNPGDPVSELPWYPQVRAIVSRQKDRQKDRREAIILSRWSAGTDGELGNYLRQEHGVEVLAPIRLGQKVLGVIVLEAKMSGDPYRDEDVELLTTFSYQAAVALEKARLFEKLKNYSGVLEDRVMERTAELERLREDERQMMIDISHRLQTPLTVVKSKLDFLKRQKNLSEHLAGFERSIDDISKFIYDLLSLARIGIKKKDFPAGPVDLSGLLRGLVEYFEVMAGERGIRFVSEIESGVFVAGDKEHLEELVMNLVSNAFKYLDAGRDRQVDIFLRRARSRALLEVADSGRGIAPEDLEKIFERFYRGKQDSDDSASGTGLGLAIAKRIVENHGGTIVIESEPGRGTKVTVTIPIRDTAD